MLYAGFRVATTPNITHAAIYLGATFVGVAGIYLLLHSEFLAALQVVVYVGAILTVMVFAIMLSKLPEITGDEDRSVFKQLASTRWGYAPLLVAALFAGVVIYGYSQVTFPNQAAAGPDNSVGAIGQTLFSTYTVPLELVAILLTATMVGAIVLTRRREEN